MSWLNKAKKAVEQTKEKITEFDKENLVQGAKASSSSLVSNISKNSNKVLKGTKNKIENINIKQIVDGSHEKAMIFSNASKKIAADSFERSKATVENIDWEKVTDSDYQKQNLNKYWQAGTNKINEVARSTLEIDKNTMDMVSDLQSKLPVPANTLDDIFTQCRQVAIERATAAFFLSGVAESIDQNSAEKYENLSENFKEYSDRIGGHNIRSHENFSEMQKIRANAKDNFDFLQDGYNSDNILNSYDADIEHVISAKEMYGSELLRAGTKDSELLDAINSKDNLVFTNSSVNRSKGAVPLAEFLEKSYPHPTKEGIRVIEVNGEKHEINEADCAKAYNKAEKCLNDRKTQAAVEIGMTAVKTGATMAVQQVVGMIIIETIDIFIEELQLFTKEFKLFDKKGLVANTQNSYNRLVAKLDQRFEEKDIWAKARSLGVEAGVSGALSVIPQIIISTITQLPALVLGMIREGTLSCVRCVRILASKDPNKLQSISVIMATTASAVVGIYISRVIGTAIAGVPLLNKFNSQITTVLSGVAITAIPLVAIYAFDQNKRKLVFALSSKSV